MTIYGGAGLVLLVAMSLFALLVCDVAWGELRRRSDLEDAEYRRRRAQRMARRFEHWRDQ